MGSIVNFTTDLDLMIGHEICRMNLPPAKQIVEESLFF
jgi:hypothetical protein